MRRSPLLGCMLALVGIHGAQAAVTISGTVTDTAGKALDSIRVTLQRPGLASFARDTTGTDGVFSISSDSTTGKLVLRSTSMGSTGYTTRNDTLVLSGKDTAGLVIKLVPIPVPVKTTVTGKIDSAGSATTLGGAIVTMRSTAGGPGATTYRDTTAADGIYSFANVATGTYTITVTATGYTTKSVIDTVKASPNTANVSLEAVVVATVSGKIDSAGSTKVISGAIVTMRSTAAGAGATTYRDTTDATGLYSFANVVGGTYTITVTATGYTTKAVTDTVKTSANTANVSLEAVIVATVSGKVDSAGSAKVISGAIVTMRSTTTAGGAATTYRDTTDAAGLYSFANVVGGTYTISVAATGYTTKSVIDTVKTSANTANISLVVPVPPKTIVLSGTISDTTGAKLDSVTVALRSVGAGAATLLRDTTGTDGAFSLTSTYLTGTYVLRMIRLTGARDTLIDTIKLDSANQTYTVVWKKSITAGVAASPAKLGIEVSLVRGELILGNLASAGTVRLLDAKGSTAFVRSVHAGQTSLRIDGNLLPGTYLLRVTQKDKAIQKRILVP